MVLEGDGFVLRRPALRDVPRVVTACTDDETQRWLPLPNPYGPVEAISFIETRAPTVQREGTGLISALEVDGQLAGMVDLMDVNWREQTVEIGYWISPDRRGQGLAGRSAGLLARWALQEQDIKRVEIRAATGNIGSQRAAVAAGFEPEGVLRSAGITPGGRVDLVVFGLTRGDLTATVTRAD